MNRSYKIQIDNSEYWYQVSAKPDTSLGRLLAEFCAKMSLRIEQVTDLRSV
jgi:hypothetical protein